MTSLNLRDVYYVYVIGWWAWLGCQGDATGDSRDSGQASAETDFPSSDR